MKLLGYLKGSGKIGNIVVASVSGASIARDYNPNISNTSTSAQVDVRARLKLASQLAAALAPVIAIPRKGMRSSRNLFIRKNFSAFVANRGVAQVSYENLQITSGNAALPAIQATRSQQAGVAVSLAESAANACTRVVYILYKKNAEGQLQYVNSVISNAAGADGVFPATLPYTQGELIFFAYGMNELSSKATATYSDYNCANGIDVARLIMSRRIKSNDMQLTRTRGTTMYAADNTTVVVPAGSSRLYLTASGNGSVNGAGVYTNGTEVTAVATPAENNTFVGWKLNGSDVIISTNATYTFTLNGLTDLVAVFEEMPAVQTYSISVETTDPINSEVFIHYNEQETTSVNINAGDNVVLIVEFREGWHFTGWRIKGTPSIISAQPEYEVTPNGNTIYEAVFS